MNLDSSNEEPKLKIPGKIILSKTVISERELKLKSLSEKWKKRKNCKGKF